MSPQNSPGRATAYLLLFLTVLFWSGNWVVGRGIRADVPPLALSFWRWTIALIGVLPLALRPLRAQWRDVLAHWRVLTLLGVLGGACHNAMTYTGLSMTTATNGILLAAATPIMIIALSWILHGKRLRRLEWLGMVVSFAGVVVIVAQGEVHRLLELHPNPGDLWVLVAMLSWALYTVLLVRRPAGLDPYAFLAAICFTGLLALSPFYAWEVARGELIVPSQAAYTAIIYAGVFPALLGFIFWNRAVAEVGSNIAGLSMNLMPAMGTILAMIFLGEQPQLFHLLGIGLILSGVWAATRPPRGLAGR